MLHETQTGRCLRLLLWGLSCLPGRHLFWLRLPARADTPRRVRALSMLCHAAWSGTLWPLRRFPLPGLFKSRPANRRCPSLPGPSSPDRDRHHCLVGRTRNRLADLVKPTIRGIAPPHLGSRPTLSLAASRGRIAPQDNLPTADLTSGKWSFRRLACNRTLRALSVVTNQRQGPAAAPGAPPLDPVVG